MNPTIYFVANLIGFLVVWFFSAWCHERAHLKWLEKYGQKTPKTGYNFFKGRWVYYDSELLTAKQEKKMLAAGLLYGFIPILLVALLTNIIFMGWVFWALLFTYAVGSISDFKRIEKLSEVKR